MSAASGTLYWIPRILARSDLDAPSTLILVGLADHVDADDRCFVGIQRLAAYGRCSYGTARRRLTALEAAGLIERTLRHRDDGGQSVYDYRLVRDALDQAPPAQPARTPPARQERAAPRAPGSAGPPAHLGARAEPPPVEPPRKEPNPLVRATLDAGFDAFWEAYPRNTAKAEARKAWPAAVKAAGSIGAIVDGAARYAADPNRDAGFTAHAATWLRGERWADDPLPARRRGPGVRQGETAGDHGGARGRLAVTATGDVG